MNDEFRILLTSPNKFLVETCLLLGIPIPKIVLVEPTEEHGDLVAYSTVTPLLDVPPSEE